ncbi:MAG: hypothetical protein QXU98_02715 [Candidatus Parvarchaeota archaeon]
MLKHANVLEQLDSKKYIICLHDYTSDACETVQKFNIILNSRKDLANDIGEFYLKKEIFPTFL